MGYQLTSKVSNPTLVHIVARALSTIDQVDPQFYVVLCGVTHVVPFACLEPHTSGYECEEA